jgi:hypothetical protein
MLIEKYRSYGHHTRVRNGRKETVKTIATYYKLRCDNCELEFSRSSKDFKHSTQTHYCKECYTKNLAQSKSAQSRRLNKYVDAFDASSGKPLGTFKL